MKRKNRSYTREFKLEAVRLCEEGDRPVAEVARELDVPSNNLYKWARLDSNHKLSLHSLLRRSAPQYSEALSGCGARILAALQTEIASVMLFYQAEWLIYGQAQPNPFNKERF